MKIKTREKEKPWLKNWPEDVPQSIQYPEVPLFELLRKTTNLYSRQTAIIFYGRKITYKELNELTDRFATALYSLGVRKGDRVGLFMPNIPQFVIAYYGALKTGAIVTAVSPLCKEREVQFQINNSEAETMVVLDLFYPLVRKVWRKTPLRRVIVTRMKTFMPGAKGFLGSLLGKIPSVKVKREPDVYFFNELIKEYPPNPPTVKIDPREDLAALQYTGGTTGTPKGAMLTHYNLVSNAVMCFAWLRGTPAKEIVLTVLPLFHIYGMTTSMNCPIYMAATMVMLPRFDIKEVLKAIERYRVTIFCGVPTMYAVLVSYPEIDRYDLTSIKFCISGAAPLPVEVQKRFMKKTGGILVEGYGLTESSPVTHCNPLDPTMKTVKIGSIGLPWPDTEAKIVDLKRGRQLPPGKKGELVVKGPQVMKGYWKMPKETAAVLKDGWLYTGDVGTMDEDGYFYITDRKKDLIKYKGYSVYPREIEEVLYEHSAVELCAVIGKPDPVAGEIPKAFVVLKKGAKASEKEIIEFVKKRVAAYKVVREVEFRKDLPKSLVGKVLRRKLREEEIRKAKFSREL
jgi:long-chain acyl-CoA synthetase